MKQEISAGGVVFFAHNADLPVLALLDMKHNWTFPKGIVDPGETFEQAAAREIGEETGITEIRLLAPLATIRYTFNRNEPIDKTVHYFLFVSESNKTPVPQMAEGITAVRWIPYKQLQQEIGYKQTNLSILDLAYRKFKNLCDTV